MLYIYILYFDKNINEGITTIVLIKVFSYQKGYYSELTTYIHDYTTI